MIRTWLGAILSIVLVTETAFSGPAVTAAHSAFQGQKAGQISAFSEQALASLPRWLPVFPWLTVSGRRTLLAVKPPPRSHPGIHRFGFLYALGSLGIMTVIKGKTPSFHERSDGRPNSVGIVGTIAAIYSQRFLIKQESDWLSNVAEAPKDLLRSWILLIAVLDDTSPGFLRRINFEKSRSFLNNRTMVNVYKHYSKVARASQKEPMVALLEDLEIEVPVEEVIARYRTGKAFHWQNVPTKTLLALLQKIADANRVPISMLTTPDFVAHLEFVDQRDFKSLFDFLVRDYAGTDEGLHRALKALDIQVTETDLFMQARNPDRNVPWGRVPKPVLAEFVTNIVTDLHLTVEDVSDFDLSQPIPLLNNQSLKGLITYLQNHSSRPRGLSAIQFLRRIVRREKKLPIYAGRRRLRSILREFLESDDRLEAIRQAAKLPSDTLLWTLVFPMMMSISRLYELNGQSQKVNAEARALLLDEQQKTALSSRTFRQDAARKMLVRWINRLAVTLEFHDRRLIVRVKIPRGQVATLEKAIRQAVREMRKMVHPPRIIAWVLLNRRVLNEEDYRDIRGLTSDARIEVGFTSNQASQTSYKRFPSRSA